MGEQTFRQLGLLSLRAIARLRLLAHTVETPVDVLAVGHDQLEPKRLEVAGGIGTVRVAVEDGEQRVRLSKLARDLRSPGNVDDPDRRGRDLLGADDLREAVEAVVGNHGHPEVRLLGDVRIRRDLRPYPGQRVEERRLPGVGKADDADPECQRLAGEADARLA